MTKPDDMKTAGKLRNFILGVLHEINKRPKLSRPHHLSHVIASMLFTEYHEEHSLSAALGVLEKAKFDYLILTGSFREQLESDIRVAKTRQLFHENPEF